MKEMLTDEEIKNIVEIAEIHCKTAKQCLNILDNIYVLTISQKNIINNVFKSYGKQGL